MSRDRIGSSTAGAVSRSRREPTGSLRYRSGSEASRPVQTELELFETQIRRQLTSVVSAADQEPGSHVFGDCRGTLIVDSSLSPCKQDASFSAFRIPRFCEIVRQYECERPIVYKHRQRQCPLAQRWTKPQTLMRAVSGTHHERQ